jgi:RNA polymerase sigma factor (sigma-70 family)
MQAEENTRSLAELAATAFAEYRDGRPDAMSELVDSATTLLWHTARAQGLSGPQAEDVVQSTWLSLVRGADRIADPQAVSGWLCTTARREAWRIRKLSQRSTPVEDEALEFRLPHQASPEAAVVLNDEQAQLWSCLAALPDRCQRLLRIVAMEQRPDYSRIAADLQMPVGSIGPTRGRCLDKLRAELTRTGGAR